MSHFPAILLCVIVLVIWIRYEIRKSGRGDEKDSKTFWEKENEANFSRKKDLSSLNYISIPMDELPFMISPENAPEKSDDASAVSSELLLAERQINNLSKKKIVNFTGITNTRLKLDYGASNLELLTDYDQNYTLLVRTLNKWAGLLLEEGREPQAKQVLEFAVSIETDIAQSYFNLAGIYKNDGEPEKINELIKKAENLKTLSKEHIKTELIKIINTDLDGTSR